MTGSALFDFLIECVALAGACYLFFYAIEGISPNALFTKIAKLAVGIAATIMFLFACKAVLFGGGGPTISPVGVLLFAIGIIVVLVVLYVIKIIVGKIAPSELQEPILFVLGAICLIALLYLAANVMFGFGPPIGGRSFRTGATLFRDFYSLTGRA